MQPPKILASKIFSSSLTAFLFISCIVFISIVVLRANGNLESLELAAYDCFMRLKPNLSGKDTRIVLITVSERDILNQGRWPLTDRTLAQVLTILSQYEPCTIGVDIFRDISVPPGRQELDSIMDRNKHIIGVNKFGKKGIAPPPVLQGKNQVGFNDIIVDPGGIVRRALLFVDDGKTVYYSFALRLALYYLQKKGIVPQPDPTNIQNLKLGPTVIRPFEENEGGYVQADARGYQFLIDFEEHNELYIAFSLTSLLSGELDAEMIKDKIVLVGVEAQSVKDVFFTPRSRNFQYAQQCPGVALHAHIVNNLIRFGIGESSPIVTISDRLETFWIFVWCLMGGIMGRFVRAPCRFSVWGLGGVFSLGLTAYTAFLYRLWIPLVPPTMAWLISASIVTAYMSNQEKRQRRILMQLFSKHVSPEVADQIWRQRDKFLDGGRPRSQKLVSTVLFSDLKGFTPVSEYLDPESLIEWLNSYMEPVAQIVMEYGGVIDDYAGDGIKANFGVPFPRETEAEIRQDAINAVNCALAMGREMERLTVLWREKNLPVVGLRIGIYTGPTVAGAVGTSQRLKYTTVGDTVNIAARLESYDKNFAKESPCRILIGESTLSYLDDQFKTKRISQVSLKGVSEKVTIYCLLGRKDKK